MYNFKSHPFLILIPAVVDCDLVEGTNVIDMKLRAGILARASTESVPLFDKSNPINVTLGIEMKKIVEVRIFFV